MRVAGTAPPLTSAVARVAPSEERLLVEERIAQIKAELETKDYESAVQAIRAAVRLPQEPADVRRFAALLARIPTDSVAWRRRCRVAILSATTTIDRAALVRLY